MKKFLIAACLLLVAVSAVRAQAQLVSGPLSVTGRIGSANLPLGAQLYDNAGTPTLAADFGARSLYVSDSSTNALAHPLTLYRRTSATPVNGFGSTIQFAIDDDTLDDQIVAESGIKMEDIRHSTRTPWFVFRAMNDGGAMADVFTIVPDGLIRIHNRETGFYGQIVSNSEMTGSRSYELPSYSGQFLLNTDADNLATANILARQLIANDGSTVALDWSDPTITKILKPASLDGATYFDNTGFHGVGSVIAGTKTATGTATTTFTVTIGVTMANTTYKVTTEGDNALSAAVHYVNNKTTTTFDIVYLAGLTGSVAVDWIISP